MHCLVLPARADQVVSGAFAWRAPTSSPIGWREWAWTTERLPEMAQQAIVGEKVGMTQTWVDDKVVPVTMLRVEPMRIVQIKTNERDGYTALQVTYGSKNAEQAEQAGSRSLRQGRRRHRASVSSNCVSTPSTASRSARKSPSSRSPPAPKVDVTGTSRGKGFAGVMKRHNFKGAPGIARCAQEPPQARRHRSVRLSRPCLQGHEHGRPHGPRAGHHAEPRSRAESDVERNILLIKGSVPGPAGGVVIVRNAVKFAGKGS